MRRKQAWWCLVLVAVLGLAGCGGGGGGGSSAANSGGSGGGSQGGSGASPEAALAASCASPRSGVDPITHVAYPDRQGTLLDEQHWLAAWTNDLYLWYSEVPVVDPSGYTTAIDYFNALKTPATTASGKPKDRFHFTYATSDWENLSLSGIAPSYGIHWAVLSATPPRQVLVSYVEPSLPAGYPVPQVSRGTSVVSIDGVLLASDNTTTGIATLNAGLSPSSVGESHVFVMQDAGSLTTRTLTLTATAVTESPVQDVQVLPGTSVGYLLFNSHVATAETALISAVQQLRSAAVTDLVLDLRYNGGGLLDVASELAYMIAGPGQTSGKTFELTQFNAKHPTVDPVTQTTIVPTPFLSTTQGFSVPAGQALPSLGLSRVYVLTGADTCSASESVINSLRGAGVTVIQIGSTTCGKPYGFYPQDNCGTTYFSIEFQGVNNLGFGNYPDGFAPQNGATTGLDPQAVLPGCQVMDDFTHALGDPAESRLAAALQYRSGGSCPTPSGAAPLPVLREAAHGLAIDITQPARSNRILRR